MIKLEIDVNGEAGQAMVFAIETLSDWKPFFERWGELWRQSRADMFATQGRSADTPWPMYSKATGEYKYSGFKAAVFGRPVTETDILTWQGGKERLRPSLTDKTHPENVSIARGNTGIFGTKVPYAANHQSGRGVAPEWAGGHNIPKRPLMNIGVSLEAKTARLMGEFAALGVNNMGRSGLSTREVAQLLRNKVR